MHTTLNAIRAHSPCGLKPAPGTTRTGLCKLLHYLGKTTTDDEPLSILTILDSNGLDDALWCLRAVTGYDREIRLYAVWCARQVHHLMTDPRSVAALDVAEQFALDLATRAELNAAWDAARDAAKDATWSAAWESAWSAAWSAAWDVARSVARDAAWDAALAAARSAARDAAWDATWDAAWEAARDAQECELRRSLTTTMAAS